jgi:hypothetical protein
MMDDSRGPGQPPATESLCRGCAHVQLITSDKGSTFLLCRLSLSDKRFAKYPPQPVVACAGYVPAGS